MSNSQHLAVCMYISECINTSSADGTYYIKSSGDGSSETCGLYLFSDANTVIEVQLGYMNVPCQTGGKIAVSPRHQNTPSPGAHRRAHGLGELSPGPTVLVARALPVRESSPPELSRSVSPRRQSSLGP